jgi:hypothetical protein
VALANQSLTTPQLAAAVSGHPDGPPPEIAAFLGEVLRRNRERNRRLWVQLMEALEALNRQGVIPVALKGAALWLWSGRTTDRLLSDLDLLVDVDQAETAVAALTGAGFQLARRQQGRWVHVVAELARPQDPGAIDLHQRPPGPPGLIDAADFHARYLEVAVDGLRVRLPDAAAQILHLVLHDQFHDGGFWRGGFDLRHCLDIAQLAGALTPGDRTWMTRAAGANLVRAALEAQLLCVERLTGAGVTAGAASRAACCTVRRWRLQFARPELRAPLAALALAGHWAELRDLRRISDGPRRRPREATWPAALTRRPARLVSIMTVRPGKI